MDLPQRKNIRLEGYDYSRAGLYFITICTKNREFLFGDIMNGTMFFNKYGEIVNNELLNISSHYDNVDIDNYVVMPNHVHMIVVIKPMERINTTERINPFPTKKNIKADIPNIIGKYKAGVTRIVGNAFMRSDIWQSRYHDHIIRNEESYQNIYEYIENNPMQWEFDCHNPVNPKYKNWKE